MRRITLTGLLAFVCIPASAQECNNPAPGPDVIVGSLSGISKYGSVNGIAGYSIGTTSCNVGQEELNWISQSNNHPVIGQNIYRIENGRMEQLGQSWLKHGFTALQQGLCCTCQSSGTGSRLGVGCSDPYGSSLNGSQSGLGPRSEVNAYTGVFLWPYTGQGLTGNAAYKRCQVANDDVDPALHPSAVYIAEGHYIAKDDAAAGNGGNNASWRRLSRGSFSSGAWSLSPTGATQRRDPAIMAWPVEYPSANIEIVNATGDGNFYVGSNCIDNGDGTWNYEYAVFNLNSHRSCREFTVPLPDGASITNIGFNDVDSHSGEPYSLTDWSTTHIPSSPASMTWSTQTESQNSNANAIRWGTMYSFWFTSSSEPAASMGSATLGLFRAGSPASISADVCVPGEPSAVYNYCVGAPNSWSPGAGISLLGSPSIAANDLTLRVDLASQQQFGLFYYGVNQVQIIFGDGFRCVSGGVVRLNPAALTDIFGTYERPVDNNVQGFTVGQTWNFQFWYRDPVAGNSGFNLSNGLSVTFQP